jgi:hypothetical protein
MLKTTKIEKHTNPWLTNSVFACLPFHHLINTTFGRNTSILPPQVMFNPATSGNHKGAD